MLGSKCRFLVGQQCVLNKVHFASIAEESWSLEDTLATLTARFHKKVLLDMYVWTDDRDSQRHIIYVRSFVCIMKHSPAIFGAI